MRRSLALLVLAASAAAQEPPQEEAAAEPVSYHRDVLPLLRARCHGCHQPAKRKGRLDMTSHALLLAGGRNGDAVVPGDPDASLLIEMVTPFAEDERPDMPEEGEPLSADEVGLLRRWIAEGALDDSPAVEAAFTVERPPVYHRPPVVTSLAFAPDGSLLAVAGRHEVLLHRVQDGVGDIVDGGIEARLVGAPERVESLAFSADGARLAVTGGTPGLAGTVQVWEVDARRLTRGVAVTHDTVRGASWSPDGTRVAFGCADNTLRAVDAASGEEVLFQGAHEDWVLDTAWSLDGVHLVSVSRDMSMKLVQVDTQQFIDNITSITPGALKGGLMAVDRHPARDELLVGGSDGTPRVYRMHREQKRVIGDDYNLIRALEPLAGRVFAVAWSPDGERAAAVSSADDGGHVRLYAAQDGVTLWSADLPARLYALAFHPDGGSLAVAGADGRVRLLDAADGRVRAEVCAVPLDEEARQ